MKINKDKLRKLHGYEEGKADAIDAESASIAADYKKNFLKHFISISPMQIDMRLGGDKYYVTRKYDGEYAIIFFDRGETVTVNRSGRVRRGIDCIEEAGKLLTKSGVKQAVIPAEIYVDEQKEHRTRVNDLVAALSDEKKTATLKLAAFDLLQLDNKPYAPRDYEATIQSLEKLFKEGKKVHAVDLSIALSNEQVREIYHEWVDKEGSEGLVVRSDMPVVYKIKPRNSIDTVVVGFTEGTGNLKGQIRTLLLALMSEEGIYQVVGRIGGGMPAELKKERFREFSKKIIPSEFIDMDSNHVAFQMIEPDTVLEISVNDIIYETGHGPIQNPVIRIENGSYRLDATIDGFSFIAPLYERFRDDKRADPADVRLSQIDEFSTYTPQQKREIPKMAQLSRSKLLLREVYRKESGEKVMIQKYLIWKTNKEKSGDYPAYVLHYTNFSTDRKELLQREVIISDSKKQILELLKKAKENNIRKGWFKVE